MRARPREKSEFSETRGEMRIREKDGLARRRKIIAVESVQEWVEGACARGRASRGNSTRGIANSLCSVCTSYNVFEISNVHNERNINLKFVILVRIHLNGFRRDCKSKNKRK